MITALASATCAFLLTASIRGSTGAQGEDVGDASKPTWVGAPPLAVDGPQLLHANVFTQWGGHTFAYLLEGREHVYWSGLEAYAGPAILGRVPKPGVPGEPFVVRIPLEGKFRRINPPQLVRTPDEHLHVFVVAAPAGDGSADVHYFRTAKPGDPRKLLDRSDLLPRTRYSRFTIRQNVGVSRDGQRIVFCNLTDFAPGEHSMNVPLLWLGERDGEDFRFREPIVYGEPTSFFYPQVAATGAGPVLLGAVHRESNRGAELVHLDWDGKVLAWEKLPGVDGESWAFDMQPTDPDNWRELAIARLLHPEEGYRRGIEFWTYDTETRELERRRTFANDVEHERSFASAGKFWIRRNAPPLFLNEPASSEAVLWRGPLLGEEGMVTLAPLPRTSVRTIGYPQIRSLFFPSLVHGSYLPPAQSKMPRPMAVDVSRPGIDRERDGDRCAFLLWWLLPR